MQEVLPAICLMPAVFIVSSLCEKSLHFLRQVSHAVHKVPAAKFAID